MGFIREPEGVDFIITPSQTAKEDVIFISNYIQEHKAEKVRNTINGKAELQQALRLQPALVEDM